MLSVSEDAFDILPISNSKGNPVSGAQSSRGV